MHQRGLKGRSNADARAWPDIPTDWDSFDESEIKELRRNALGQLNPARRVAMSPIGPPTLICRPCDHHWSDHDDDGCRWLLCACGLPGERK